MCRSPYTARTSPSIGGSGGPVLPFTSQDRRGCKVKDGCSLARGIGSRRFSRVRRTGLAKEQSPPTRGVRFPWLNRITDINFSLQLFPFYAEPEGLAARPAIAGFVPAQTLPNVRLTFD